MVLFLMESGKSITQHGDPGCCASPAHRQFPPEPKPDSMVGSKRMSRRMSDKALHTPIGKLVVRIP